MKYALIFLPAFFIACKSSQTVRSTASPSNLVADGKLWSSLFQQRAAEYKALCYQAFNVARWRLDESLMHGSKPKAIITDIDETFLDNSPYAVHRALLGKDYDSESWAVWTSKGSADTLAGALSFFKYAASRGVEIFYITNRKNSEKDGTLSNLKKFQFPFSDEQHLILRKDSSSKETRRQRISATHDIILLLGDNLSDFSDLFDSKPEDERATNVGLVSAEFGKRYIVLPNANYGGWEEAVYNNTFKWTAAQKDSLIRKKLKGY